MKRSFPIFWPNIFLEFSSELIKFPVQDLSSVNIEYQYIVSDVSELDTKWHFCLNFPRNR